MYIFNRYNLYLAYSIVIFLMLLNTLEAKATPFIPITVNDITIVATRPVKPHSVEITNITSTSATINWQTNTNTTSLLHYSSNPNINPSIIAPSGGDSTADQTQHTINITGLSSDTIYYFEILGEGNNGQIVLSTSAQFMTLKDSSLNNPNHSNDLPPPPHNAHTENGKSSVPYWISYLHSRMTSNHTITYCRKYNSQGDGCVGFSAGTETHLRRNIGDWRPFYGPNSGNRPGYYKGSTIGSINNPVTYYTNWYLHTDELAVNTRWYDPSTCGSSQSASRGYCDLKIDLVIWPGEVKKWRGSTWAVAPMSEDILNTNWIAFIPRDKTLGKNGVEWRNYPVSIDQNLIVGGSHPPKRGLLITPRSSIIQTGDNQYEIYISGVNTSGNIENDLSDYFTSVDNLNNLALESLNSNVINVLEHIVRFREENPNTRFTIIGHSLGSVDATVIYNSGYLTGNDRVYGIGIPRNVDADAMQQENNPAQIQYYCGTNDIICQKDFGNSSNYNNTTKYRQELGVPILEINTGAPGGFKPHSRDTYSDALGWEPW